MRHLLLTVCVLALGACQQDAQPVVASDAAVDTTSTEAEGGGVASDPANASLPTRTPLATHTATSRDPLEFNVRGQTIRFPLGAISFADEVLSFRVGDPGPANPEDARVIEALGPPDYDQANEDQYLNLGCGGQIVFRFVDNALTDGPGDDLFVFEIGPMAEETMVAISDDGVRWIDVGAISGGHAGLDIGAHVQRGAVFHYVRLTDAQGDCSSDWPGADIDAVGAIGGALQFSLDSAVLFDTGRSELRPEARAELDRLAAEIGRYSGGRITVEGHTDAVGSDADNMTLSRARAEAVRAHLDAVLGSSFTLVGEAYGESRPLGSNDTEEGRARNRRVAVIMDPS